MGLIVNVDSRLQVHCSGIERVLSFFAAVDVPIQEIEEVRVVGRHRPRGFRVLGTGLPGLIAVGRYRAPSGWEFWRVYLARQVLEIKLGSGPFRRLILQTKDPHGLAERITRAHRG